MTTEAERRLRDLVTIPDMAPDIGSIRKDVGELLAEVERLRCKAEGGHE